jgi:outer membrane protein assembly factor BamB
MASYGIKLTREEVSELTSILKKGSHSSQSYRAACVLLNCDDGDYALGKSTNGQISHVLKIGMRTIDRIKQRFVEGGIERALERVVSHRIYTGKVDGDLEAMISQLFCSEPPEGYARWTFRLLAKKVVELGYAASISHVTVYHVIKKADIATESKNRVASYPSNDI